MSENNDLKQEIEELKKTVQTEIENRKKIAKTLLSIANKLDQHLKGQMTLDDLQSCLQKVQEMVSLLESSGMIHQGEGQGGLLASALVQMMRQQQTTQSPTIEKANMSSSKLKKMLEEDDDES
jgi:cell division septum initiation protein DivIVA